MAAVLNAAHVFRAKTTSFCFASPRAGSPTRPSTATLPCTRLVSTCLLPACADHPDARSLDEKEGKFTADHTLILLLWDRKTREYRLDHYFAQIREFAADPRSVRRVRLRRTGAGSENGTQTLGELFASRQYSGILDAITAHEFAL
mgnify:CR=1 FL=1